MLLWVIFAVMAALAVLAVLWPLGRASAPAPAAHADVAIYRDQLRTLEDEAQRGLLGEADVAAARTEISRRLLAADDRAAAAQQMRRGAGPLAAALLAGFIVASSVGLYLLQGAPQLPGQPLAARLQTPVEGQDVETLVARVEAHLAADPEDGQGWDVLAPVYFRLGRYEDAARGFANAVRILGPNAKRLSGLGEALTQANEGIVTADAKQAFLDANRLDPALVRPRFYLALALEQDGARGEAIAAWRRLAADSPQGAPWLPLIDERLAALNAAPASAAPKPTDDEIAAAQSMSADDRKAMVEGMVGRLASRLAEDGNDLDGWLRLMRAYMVLGRGEDARTALASARRQFAAEQLAMERIAGMARELGLEN